MDYLLVKLIHQSTVALSISLFSVRAIGVLSEARWAGWAGLRIAQHVNDTSLLLSAVTLATLSGMAPWNTSWLAVKIGGLLIYIALGTQVMRGKYSLAVRCLLLGCALLVFAFIVSVALSRSVTGFFG